MKKEQLSNFAKLLNIDNTHEEESILEDFSELEQCAINRRENIWVVYAIDKFLSGWGPAENTNAHQFIICWSREQKNAIYETLINDKTFSRTNCAPLRNFLKGQHKDGIWTIKNANNCHAWNKGVLVNIADAP